MGLLYMLRNRIRAPFFLSILAAIAIAAPVAARDANRTAYPIVFAHGAGGFDDILGYDYWGNDYGTYVLDPCDKWFETSCNPDINRYQKSFVAQVTPLQSSEVRGYDLYQDILGYMATSGATRVNLVGHSQGGLDLRKAARLLYEDKGYRVVQYGISISTPHRGVPTMKYILDLGPGVASVIEALGRFYGNIVYGSGNEPIAAAKQFVYHDYDPGDGQLTGNEVFNLSYPASTTYIARPRSIITVQDGISLNPALWLLSEGIYDIDADGYATTDANGDGALGTGDGNPGDWDDDGLVGLNSQQMGYRLDYVECWPCLDYVFERTSTGYVGDLNAPSPTAMTSYGYVVWQDHLDVVGVGPDTFDEMEFYAALTDYIADGGY